MPKISKKRQGEIETLRPLVKWLNGEFPWQSLKREFVLLKGMRDVGEMFRKIDLRHPEKEVKFDDPKQLPTDDAFKDAATWLTRTLIRWMAALNGKGDGNAISDEIDECFSRVYRPILEKYPKVARELLLGKSLSGDPLGKRFRIFSTWIAFGDDLSLYAQALALRLYLLADGAPNVLRKCRRRDCTRYFLNASGQQEYCNHRHAQAAINNKRRKKVEERLTKIKEALKDWNSAKGPWKEWAAKRARVTKTFLTRAVNTKRLTPPKGASNGG